MGVGKTTTCQILKRQLDHSVFLDGDWCWDAHPFVVTAETKTMVMDNICDLLNRFIACSVYQHIIFCWVMHEQAIIDEIRQRLDLTNCQVIEVSLIASPISLKKRLEKDVAAGIRQADVIERSLARLSCYQSLSTHKIDVSDLTAKQAAGLIMQLSSLRS